MKWLIRGIFSSLHDYVDAISNYFDRLRHPFCGGGNFKTSRSAPLSEVIVILKVAETKSGPPFNVTYLDLCGGYIEGLLESRQILDVVLTENKAGRGWCAVLAD